MTNVFVILLFPQNVLIIKNEFFFTLKKTTCKIKKWPPKNT